MNEYDRLYRQAQRYKELYPKLSPSTVHRGIRDLKKAGLLETEQRYRKKGGKSSLLFRLKAE